MAEQLVGNLSQSFDPAKYTDDYRANVMKIIRAKMKGKKSTVHEPEKEPADSQVFDLMSRLEASLKENKGKGRAVRAARKGAAATEKPARAKRARRRTA